MKHENVRLVAHQVAHQVLAAHWSYFPLHHCCAISAFLKYFFFVCAYVPSPKFIMFTKFNQNKKGKVKKTRKEKHTQVNLKSFGQFLSLNGSRTAPHWTTPTQMTPHQDNSPPQQFPTRTTPHQDNSPPEQIPIKTTPHQDNSPPEQIPTRTTSHQEHSPPEQILIEITPHQDKSPLRQLPPGQLSTRTNPHRDNSSPGQLSTRTNPH